jgi:tyrosine-protein kinase Etk/Wzc
MTEADTARFDLIGLVLHRWRAITICAVIGVAAAAAYAYFAPNWYEAQLTVVPSQRSQDAAMSIAAKLPISLDSMTTDVQRIQAVLRSNSVADEVIDKFKLDERYEAPHREATRAALWSHCRTGVDRRSGVVSLACEDQDPKMARDITAYFGEVGNKVFGRVTVSSAREERKFLETQMLKARDDVDDASRKLREFQEKHHVVDLPEQSKAVISAMASIQGELLSKQLELSYLSKFSASTEPGVVQLRQQIALMQSKLTDLEASQGVTSANAGSGAGSGEFFPGAMQVPKLRFELEQLLREQKIRETVFFLMTQRFEIAKVDEARDTSTFQILDYPTVPTHKSRPKRLRILMTGLFLSLVVGTAVIVVPAWWRRRKKLASVA